MNKENIIDGVCILISSLFTAAQTKEVLQIVSFILTIVSILIVIIRNIIDWYIKAKKDGKIDAKDIKDGIDIVADGVEKITNVVESKKREEK